MALFKLHDYEIYFEEYGTGTPLILLNGIMMSTNSWKPFIETFSQKHRLILVDLLDQGRSSKLDGLTYDLDIQVDVVKGLCDHLKLDSIDLFGISYGGEVAMRFAIAHPHYLRRLMLFNTTAYTSPWLREIGNAWNRAAKDPEAYYATTIPVIYSARFYTDNQAWMEKRKELLLGVFANPVFINAMIRLTNSANDHDVRHLLDQIQTPTLVVSCEHDYITPSVEQTYIASRIKHASLVMIPDSGHASMYEKPMLFSSLVLGFVSTSKTDSSI
ncbi:MAG: alpha/beta hydrolase [Erysipelotrichaceae bacterium]